MKKVICVVLLLCLFPVVSMAEDLASMSYEDLIALSQRITSEIMSRPEWKEVEVPSGIWTVGVDIPAGVYSITPVGSSANFACYDENGRLQINLLCLGGKPIGKVELKEGWTVEPSKPVIFAPPMALGF